MSDLMPVYQPLENPTTGDMAFSHLLIFCNVLYLRDQATTDT